ncbi:MAG TPA: LytR C-terminal domain-containing protein [Geodermatophilus sp.]|nr:LytR C-terminal domain-containing protein [Geodermatophilus sp.]
MPRDDARKDDAPAPRRGLPPVPGARPQAPALEAGPQPGAGSQSPGRDEPASPAVGPAQPPRSGLPPVPPPARSSVPLFPPLGPGGGSPPPRPMRPLPPIPGRDVPAGGGAAPAPPGDRPSARAARRAARSPGRRRLIRAATGLAAVVGVVLAYHLGLYFYVDQSIDRVEALAVDGPEVIAPQLQEDAATYLVVGTDLPGAEGPAAVATLLVHVSADGERAVLVSVPPTALVDTPACRTADGDEREPTSEPFAASLLEGGPACMVRAVQQLSGLRIDHYLGIDLARLPAMIDALGGVGVCLPAPSAAVAASARPLPAGASRLSGEDAAQYLTPGDAGSDVTGAAVAERTQLLLTATLRAALSVGTLGDPATLTRFLVRAGDALTVDESTNLGDLRTLAASLGDLTGDAVQRTGLPVSQVGYVPAGSDQALVLLDGAATRTLFDEVIDAGQLPEAVLAAQASADVPAEAATEASAPTAEAEQPAEAPAPQPLTVAPGGVTVDVLNGTGTTGLAATVADLLRGQGFVVGQVGNEQGTVNQTVVRHGSNTVEQARTVAAAVPGSVLQASETTGDRVQLVLGPGYSSVVPVEVGTAPEETAAAPSTEPAASAGPVSCD